MVSFHDPNPFSGGSMEYNEVLDRLRDLIRLDIDAAHAYAMFLAHFDDAQLREKIARFRKDHEMHIMELTSMVTSIEGESAPSYSEEFGGFSTEGFKTPSGEGSLEEAIHAMVGNERLLVAMYKEVVAIHEMPPEFHMVIDRYYGQEQKHLAFLEELLEREEVERAGAT
jgi:rubrerythrin